MAFRFIRAISQLLVRPSRETLSTRQHRKYRRAADLSALIDTLRAEGKAYRNEEQREDRGKKFRDWLTIVVLVITAIAIWWQVREMVRTYKPIEDQAAASQKAAEASAKAAEAAREAADAAVAQSKTSETTLLMSQRAWLGPTHASIAAMPEVGKSVEISIQYQNTGRTPALGFIFGLDPFTMLPTEDRSPRVLNRMTTYANACKGHAKWDGGSVVYPLSGFNTYTLTSTLKDPLITEDFIKRKRILLVQGCFLYRTFDLPKHSYFCYFFDPQSTKIGNLNICTIGHDAD